MSYYAITGKKAPSGTITVLGAKNFATKAMVAALLTDQEIILSNMPNIGDIELTQSMLADLGVKLVADKERMQLSILADKLSTNSISQSYQGANRIPILLLGCLLHRCDKVTVPFLGGCQIGPRPVNFHLEAIEKFGGTVEINKNSFTVHRGDNRLTANTIKLPYPSVGATETCIFLSVLAKGRSVIENTATEPEIISLISMLQAMGAIIHQGPNRELKIEGVEKLKGCQFTVPGDRIEAASWAALACAHSQGELTVAGIKPDHLGNFLSFFRQIGGGFDLCAEKKIRFYREKKKLSPIYLQTDVWPGFSTDWQQPFSVLLTQAHGISIIHETVYENRLGYLNILNQMGAMTKSVPYCLGDSPCRFRDHNHLHSAIIQGESKLTACPDPIPIPDLRAGLAYLIFAAIAEGTTKLSNIHYLTRGYGDLPARLAGVIDLELIE